MNIPLRVSLLPRVAVTPRGCMETLAQALGVALGPEPDAGLSLAIDAVHISIATTRQGRIVAFFRLAEVDAMSREAMVAGLAESALWGVRGESLRFVVVDGHFALLWSTPPQPEMPLLEDFDEALHSARSVARLAMAFPA